MLGQEGCPLLKALRFHNQLLFRKVTTKRFQIKWLLEIEIICTERKVLKE